LLCGGLHTMQAEDGYRLWLRYDEVADRGQRDAYNDALSAVVLQTPSGAESPVIASTRAELARGLGGLLDREIPVHLVAGSGEVVDAGNDGYALAGVT